MIPIVKIYFDFISSNKRLIILIICILITQYSNSQNQREIELERQINTIIQSYPIAGIGVAVLNADTIFYMNGFGYSNLENKRLYTYNTIQNIASVSKTVIGISLMKAEELGLFNIDDRIDKYLPFAIQNPTFKDDEITILQLATHTSSINDRSAIYDLKCYLDVNEPIISLKDFVFSYFNPKGKWYSKKNFTKEKPGTAYEYSNIGATLAAYIIEVKSGMSYREFTKKYIFDPLNMKNTGWYFSDIDSTLHTTLYNSNFKERKPYQLITYPDGGLRTCIQDLSAYFQMILNKGKFHDIQIVEKESIEKMISPRFNKDKLPINFEMINQGVFWEIEQSMLTREMEGHSGGDPGVFTMMFYLPEINIGIIMLANTNADNNNINGYNEVWKTLVEYAKTL